MAYKILDLTILVLVVIFFVDVLTFEYDTLGLQQPIMHISVAWKSFFEILIYPIVILLIIDLVLKYRKVNDPRKFIKKYWIYIAMLILIPVFSIFKFFKISLGLIKKLKTVKMGAKALDKTKKVTQNDL